jgi:hypothetical protein
VKHLPRLTNRRLTVTKQRVDRGYASDDARILASSEVVDLDACRGCRWCQQASRVGDEVAGKSIVLRHWEISTTSFAFRYSDANVP